MNAGVALGMRRLSIIDLSTGHQPIHNEDGTVWVVFNGEIYNFRELRRELEAAGHRFYTSSDTEIDRPRLRGVGQRRVRAPARHVRHRDLGHPDAHAAARARPPRHQAAVLRDVRRAAVFGSELKSLLAAPDLPRDLDPDALDHYLSFLYTPRDGSIFKSVRKLPPAIC